LRDQIPCAPPQVKTELVKDGQFVFYGAYGAVVNASVEPQADERSVVARLVDEIR
jgi:hypothetical protein